MPLNTTRPQVQIVQGVVLKNDGTTGVALILKDERGGTQLDAIITPEQARKLAKTLCECADDAEAFVPVPALPFVPALTLPLGKKGLN